MGDKVSPAAASSHADPVTVPATSSHADTTTSSQGGTPVTTASSQGGTPVTTTSSQGGTSVSATSTRTIVTASSSTVSTSPRIDSNNNINFNISSTGVPPILTISFTEDEYFTPGVSNPGSGTGIDVEDKKDEQCDIIIESPYDSGFGSNDSDSGFGSEPDSCFVDIETNTDSGVWIPEETPTPNQESYSSDGVPDERFFLAGIFGQKYLPILVILVIKQLYDHGDGLVCMLALMLTFETTNFFVTKEVAKQGRRRIWWLLVISTNLLICGGIVYLVYWEERLYPALICLETGLEPVTFSELLWIVCLTDYMVKILAIIVKTVVIALPERILPFRNRGKYYVLIEATFQLYRSVLPIQPWLFYLFVPYQKNNVEFGITLCSIYGFCKLLDLIFRGVSWKRSLDGFHQPQKYGKPPNVQEIQTAELCAICQDSFKRPTRLICSHIFCQQCLTTWFDRECTCPMCRVRVIRYPWHRNGSTDHFIQIF